MLAQYTLKLIIFVLMLLLGNSYVLAEEVIDTGALSPRLNLDNILFKTNMSKTRQDLLERLKMDANEAENPYAVLGEIRWRVQRNDENLIIREQVKDNGSEKEVHQSLTRLLDNGSEKFLGQCWYRINKDEATLAPDAANFKLPAFKVNEEGNGYGTIIFAAALESAKSFGVTYFSIIISRTSIYERFGFKEIELGVLDKLYKILKPEDPSAFDIAVTLSKERGLEISFSPEIQLVKDPRLISRNVEGVPVFVAQSI